MKTAFYLLCWAGCLLAQVAQAQGPTLDPTFRFGGVYQPATVDQAIPQPDGKLLFISTASRVGGRPANGKLSRLLANSDQVDTVFAANVAALQGIVQQAAVLPNNHIVLISFRGTSLSLGGVTRHCILGLNADGTVDTAFNAITTASFLTSVAAQPDGKVVVGGAFAEWSPGQPAKGMVRLTATGSLDAGFQSAIGQGFDGIVDFVSLQSNGSLIVSGRFDHVDGNPQNCLARLLSNGAFDTTFRPTLPAWSFSVIINVVGALTQPDGKVVVASFTNLPMPNWQPLERLLPSGAHDPAFQTGTNFAQCFSYQLRSSPLCLLASGKLLVGTVAGSFDGVPIGELVRLTAAGRLDPTFANALVAGPGLRELSAGEPALTLLPGGQVLAAGIPARYGGEVIPTPLARLDSASGGRISTFTPLVHVPGEVSDVARQADGRYLVAGVFTEINGSASAYLARLAAGGAVEPAFTAAAQPDNPVYAVALQADGKIVVGGAFQTLAGSVFPGVGRLLPGGAPDPAFAPAFPSGTAPYPVVGQVALEPGGSVLLGGSFAPARTLVRLNGQTGAYDPAFATNYSGQQAMLVQPDGNILLGGASIRVVSQGAEGLVRLLPSGAPDPAFTPIPASFSLFALARDPATGQIYATGQMNSLPAALRFSATGTRDLSYAPNLQVPGGLPVLGRSLAVQPNGRLLLGGTLYPSSLTVSVGLARLLPAGAQDAGFASAAGPAASVNKILVQPDGAIMVAGTFTTVGGTPAGGLARLLDAQVLAVGRAQGSTALAAWPVPAHEVLHLRLDAAAGPVRVALLDALGREVRAQVISQPELALSVAGLPAGVYLLRVAYASGPVTRRVVVAE